MERQKQKEVLQKREAEKLERLNRIRKRKGLPEIVPEPETGIALYAFKFGLKRVLIDSLVILKRFTK